MTVEATIVEQLQELRKWQLQQQEELMRQQEQQRELLSNKQSQIFQALSLSVEEINLSEQSLKEIVEQKKKEEGDLIDFDTPKCTSPMSQMSDNYSKFLALTSEKNNYDNKDLDLIVPKLQLAVRNSRTDLKPNLEINNYYNHHDYSSESFIDSTQSFSSEKSQKYIPIDDLPVPSPKKDFNTLLEERLKDAEAINIENKTKPVIKRPFLKKGQGLTRFMPNSNPEKASKCTMRPRSASFTSTNSNNALKSTKLTKVERCNSMPRTKKLNNPKKTVLNPSPVAQQRLSLKNIPPPQKSVRSKSVGPVLNLNSNGRKKPPEILSDSNVSDIDVKNKREMEEVRIFELLEDKAENSSFCSTSSTVIAFLQQSTPLKHKALLHSASKHKISLNDIGDETLEEIVRSTQTNHPPVPNLQNNFENQKISQWDDVPLSKVKNDKTVTGTILPYGTDMDINYQEYSSNQEDDNNVSLHVRFSEYNEYKTMTDTSSISSDSQTTISNADDKGAWSDSVTPDSSDVDSVISSQIKKNSDSGSHFLKNNENERSDEEEVFKTEDHEKIHTSDEEDTEEEVEIQNVTVEKDDTVIDEKNESTSLFKSELLKTRLLELEQEIEIFRKESAALTIQRQKLQEERIKLQEERLKLQRSFDEKEKGLEMEKKKMDNILLEERKRLAREKTSLESRMKDAWEKAQKSKQERQEIQTLKEQLEELKEDIAQKESKWSATNARQRSQMRVLQTENSKLKQEIEKLQQKKMKFKKPVASSNTKAIHQINKFLTDRKKISPFKNDDVLCCEDQVKIPEKVEENYEIEVEEDKEKSVENEAENVKFSRTAESIARTRNLYESLLRDATEGFSEVDVSRRNLMNRQADTRHEKLGEPIHNKSRDDEDSAIESRNKSSSVSPKSPRTTQEELEKSGDEKGNVAKKVTNNKQGIREVHHPDGRIEYWYPNGNVKKIYPDKCLTKMIYYNGDVRETDKNGTVKYFYSSTRTWHTTMPDGLEILEFPDGQVERRSKDGTIEVSFPDGSVRIVQSDGSEKWALRDGTIAETSANGEKVLTLPNGQREIHTKEHKRREYPDGTVKLVYPDGIQETRYANGRVRLKDKDGNLLMDTHQ